MKLTTLKIIQDMDKAILVMRDAGRWLEESGKHPSQSWKLENLNKEYLLKYAKSDEFYVAVIDDKPAAAAIFQENQIAQDWKSVDKDISVPALYIHWLCVSRDFAGQGLPKVMIDYAQLLAKQKGIVLLRLDTHADEKKLRTMYESLGFHLVAIVKEDDRDSALYQRRIE